MTNSMGRTLYGAGRSVAVKCVLAAMTLTITSSARAAQSPPPARPNVVLIVADDMGFADVGYNGCTDIKTPRIDQLAASGVKLAQFYVQPLCSPTRAALMTGRYPMRHGLQVGVVRPWANYGLPLEERTLAQALHEAGYETAITGKWHLGHVEPAYLPTHRGFDHQYGHYNGALDYFTHVRDGGLDWHRDDQACREEGYSTHLVAAEAVKRIEQRDASKPLFLYVPFNAVHAPLQVPEKYKTPYDSLPEPRRTYAGMVAAMDEATGTILDALDRAKMRDNTLVIFTSDNGGPAPGKVTSNAPFRGGKGGLLEGGVHVAACASFPGHIPAGGAVEQSLHAVDVYPTVVKLAGKDPAAQPLKLDGVDAWATIASGAPSPHREILLNATPINGAIRMGDWKLIIEDRSDAKAVAEVAALEGEGRDAAAPSAGSGATNNRRARRQAAAATAPGGSPRASLQLYDLARDPTEKSNLADSNPLKVKELRAAYDLLAAQAIPPKARPKADNFQVPAVWGEK